MVPGNSTGRLRTPQAPPHTLGGLAARLALLEARIDGLASKSDVETILESILRQNRRHFWRLTGAMVPICITTLAALAEIARVIALGKP
jgi:hypothetical protein